MRGVRVLVVNAGSSSLKLRLLGGDDVVSMERDLPVVDGRADLEALTESLAGHPPPDAIGHRIVHGGERYRRAVRIDAEVLGDLRALSELAPLHQLPALEAEAVVARALPGVPSVACFDTAFHGTLPGPPRPTRFLARGASAGRCADTVSTGSPTPTLRAAPASCSASPSRSCGS